MRRQEPEACKGESRAGWMARFPCGWMGRGWWAERGGNGVLFGRKSVGNCSGEEVGGEIGLSLLFTSILVREVDTTELETATQWNDTLENRSGGGEKERGVNYRFYSDFTRFSVNVSPQDITLCPTDVSWISCNLLTAFQSSLDAFENICRRMSQAGCTDACWWLIGDYGLGGYCKGEVPFSSHHVRGCVVGTWLITDDIYLDYLVEVVSARLHCNMTVFLFLTPFFEASHQILSPLKGRGTKFYLWRGRAALPQPLLGILLWGSVPSPHLLTQSLVYISLASFILFFGLYDHYFVQMIPPMAIGSAFKLTPG